VFVDHVISDLTSCHTLARHAYFKKHPPMTTATVSSNLSGWSVFFASKKKSSSSSASMGESSNGKEAKKEGDKP